MKTTLAMLVSACVVACSVGLSACGGGGGGTTTCTSGIAGLCDKLSDPGTTPVVGSVFMQLALTDGAGTTVTSVAPERAGVLHAAVADGSGKPVPNTAITFTSTDKTGAFVPASGTALTNAAGLAQVGLVAGAQTGAFTVTATAAVGDNSLVARVSYTVAYPTLAFSQITFVSALPQNIAIKGTGGPGRQESSTVTFKVLDKSGKPVAGTLVNFFVFSSTGITTGTGGLTLSPNSAYSGADGSVSTVVQSGIVNTPVRISATISGSNPAVTSLSDQLVVSTGIPDQNSFSLSTQLFNVEGMSVDGCASPTGSKINVMLSDHFNNPVPDGTAVSFTTEGGSIGASCLTGLGSCAVDFCAAAPRPADGRVTVLAYALGEESFSDDPMIKDGINRYDPGEPYQDLREPFRYDRAVSNAQAMAANLPTYSSAMPATGEPFIDTDGNGLWNSTGDGAYNGVLNVDPVTQQTVSNGNRPTVHVRQSIVLVLSGSTAAVTPLSTLPLQLERCVSGTPFVNFPKSFSFAVRDTNPTIFPGNTLAGNVLPAGTTIEFSASMGTILGGYKFVVPNTNETSSAVWTYPVAVQSTVRQGGPSVTPGDAYVCENAVTGGLLSIKVTTPLGIVSTWSYPISN